MVLPRIFHVKRRRAAFLLLVSIWVVIFWICGPESDRVVPDLVADVQSPNFHQIAQSPTILIWTECDYIRRTFQNCPVPSKFVITTDRSQLNNSAAVIFCLEWMKWYDLPPPSHRRSDQYYVFFTTEAPPMVDKLPNFHFRLNEYPDFFNLTLTYRLDSDIQYPYGKFYPLPSEKTLDIDEQLQMVEVKTKMVAWMASHCRTPSGRERFVQYLNYYIPVDIYGKCGNLKCVKTRKEQSKQCEELLERDYKFYIAFENSLCREYVTEKLFRILGRLLVIPIVLQRKIVIDTIQDPTMAKVINTSFIAVDDFDYNAKKLAAYLKYLNENVTAYLEYFQWKRWYGVVDEGASLKPGCQLCQLISEGKKHVIKDIHKWYIQDAQCQRPKRFQYNLFG